MIYTCESCGEEFEKKVIFNRHVKSKCRDEENKECKYCFKVFTSQNNMYRHMKHTCKMKPKTEIKQKQIKKTKTTENKVDELEKQIAKLKNEVKILKKQNKNLLKAPTKGNTTNIETMNNNNSINNTINITNNITLYAYGKEDLSKIPDNEIQRIIEAGFQSVQTMTNYIHFNEDYPEYSNVYINDLKNKYATIYDGKNEQTVSRKDLVNRMYNRNKNYIEDNMDRFIDKLKPSKKKALERWMSIDDDGDERIVRIIDDLNMTLYTNRAIPKAAIKQAVAKS